MQYELRWFDQLIRDQHAPSQASTDKYSIWHDYLQQQTTPLAKQFTLVGKVDPEGNYRIVSSHTKILGSQATIPWIDHNSLSDTNATVGNLVDQVIPSLNIRRDEVQQVAYWEDQRGTHLEIFARQRLDNLMPYEVRYAFYLYHLEEHTRITKQRLTDTVCKLSSDKKSKKYVQDHQQILIRQCTEVMQHLSEEERVHIYCLSEELGVTDIYKCCFHALEELLVYLEQHFGSYMDVNAHVPYRSRLISSYQLVKQSGIIREALQTSLISSELLSVLEEPFAKIAHLNTEPTTYAELLYLKKFIQELNCLAERDSINDYQVAASLFRINFNRPPFLSWMMSRLDECVAQATTLDEKLQILYGHRKRSQQLCNATKQAYQPGLLSLNSQIRQYIEEDIQRYQQELSARQPTVDAIASSETEETTSERVPTPLTVAQLAHLLGLLFEVKVFPRGTKKTVFRWFARMVATPRVDRLSANSLYDRQYEVDDASREVVQQLLQRMMNLSRKAKR